MTGRHIKLLLYPGLLLFALNCYAAVPWSDLTPQQQKFLSSHHGDWDQLNADRQQELIEISLKWCALSSREKKRLRRNVKHWQTLDTDRKKTIKQWFYWYQQQPIEVQKRIKENKKTFKQFSKKDQRHAKGLWQQAAAEKGNNLVKAPIPVTASND